MDKNQSTERKIHAVASTTVIEQSLLKLRNLIMTGKLQPGRKLVEADLCRELAISRASVREALRILERERLIELVPNKGPSVARLGWQEIEEIHDVWAMLTSEAVYRFVELAKPEDLASLDQAETQLAAAVKSGLALDQLAATNLLFATILGRCGNRVLTEIVYVLVARLNFLRAQALRYEGWGHLCLHEVREIVAAIAAKNAMTARAATRRHIDSACAAAKQVALLSNAEPEQPAADRRRRRRPLA